MLLLSDEAKEHLQLQPVSFLVRIRAGRIEVGRRSSDELQREAQARSAWGEKTAGYIMHCSTSGLMCPSGPEHEAADLTVQSLCVSNPKSRR